MAKHRVPPQRPVAAAPAERLPRLPPVKGESRPASRLGPPPQKALSPPPAQRAVAARPNPRRPRLVRDVGGNELLDLFAVFPDLPRPQRPSAKLPVRRRPWRLSRG